eukprot:CAMPEP_0113596704 /NCGR_PEP_ID=MMETSP0015_2-20120614/40497_1 /TAXON_ID=2838 /ORGANISM="Odontella" /LENGTH=364 /DNA_ID=CAMNT_0000504275 /DNA_START=387 /DNA_END=1481 /DNA_ORIENTATION=+ /assembly_acc=CAM_ASM_000160
MGGVTAAVVYELIVKRQGTPGAYLTGFGVLIPAVLACPFFIISALDIRCMPHRLALFSFPGTVAFRISEAMFGFAPPAAKKSMKNYVTYYASLMEATFDPKTEEPVRATSTDMIHLILDFLPSALILTMLFSLASPWGYAPNVTSADAHSMDHTLGEIFSAGHLMNNFIAAALLSFSLSFGSKGVSLLFCLLTGVRTQRMVDNPMFASTSPSDFWGRRWNTLIHGALKRGVFKPVWKYSTRTLAVFATFLASGAIHEYTWAMLFYVHEHQKDEYGKCPECFYPVYGKSIVFFGWNGVLVVMESLIGHTWLVQMIRNALPRMIITALVVMMALPVGHLFTGDWIKGGYFQSLQLGFPLIIKMDEA